MSLTLVPSTLYGFEFRRMYMDYLHDLSEYTDFEGRGLEDICNGVCDEGGDIHKYILVEGKTNIGFVILQHIEPEKHGVASPLWYVVEFYIKPAYRRKGYGTAAAKTLFQMLNPPAFLYILLKNHPAQMFWGTVENRLHLSRIFRNDVPCYEDCELRVYDWKCALNSSQK